LISVVIPTYNRQRSIVRAVQSALAQTHRNVEVIVVDDASTDNTCSAVQQLPDDRVKLLRHETNRYAGAARNSGMEISAGQYVAFLDSDDVWLPVKLERQLEAFQEFPQAGMCCTGLTMMPGRGINKKVILPDIRPQLDGDRMIMRYLLSHSYIITSTVMLRSDILPLIGPMDTSLRRNQDIDFFLRIMKQFPVISVEEPLVEFYPNDQAPSLTTIQESNQRLFSNHQDLLQRLGQFRERRVKAFFKFRHGQRQLAAGDISGGVKTLCGAVAISPFLPPRQFAGASLRPVTSLVRRFLK
jgi:glycosyltransferase involved in cell wall biosynthesis